MLTDGNNLSVDGLADAIVAASQRAGIVPAQAAPAAKQSKLQEQMNALRNNPESDQDTLAALEGLFKNFEQDIKADLTQAQREETIRTLTMQRDKHAKDLIKFAVHEYVGNDEFLKEYDSVLIDKVIKEFNGNKDYEAARKRYAEMDVDAVLLKEIALNEVTKFNKARGKETVRATGSAGMRRDNLESKHIAQESEDGGGRAGDGAVLLDPNDMDSKERALYNARISTMQKMGKSRDSVEAKKSASGAVLKMRQAKTRKPA